MSIVTEPSIADRPDPPQGPVRIENTTKHSVDLTWREPADNGGSAISGYIVEKMDMTTHVWRRALTTTTTSTTVSCLEEFKVRSYTCILMECKA